jgi:nifR3 family TIM-barrel protein
MRAEYQSELNRDVPVARDGEFRPVEIGPLSVWPPVVLAPMAAVTNYPFRKLCRRFGADRSIESGAAPERSGDGARASACRGSAAQAVRSWDCSGLYVSEMITARALVYENDKTLKLADFGPDEDPRSLQLYGTDPHYTGEAVKRLVGEGRVDHVDMNFGCPVRKVTRKGGGAAIPVKPKLLRAIIRAAVSNAGDVPVTIKFRMGIDDSLLTYLEAGRIGEGEGCAAVALHARTAAQLYDGHADWSAIAALKEAVRTIPVLGNGDIWEGWDALRMMRSTGCDGVVVGRGCLGRPWLFRDLADVFDGREPCDPPTLGEVADVMIEHSQLLEDWFGARMGIRGFRRHATWYTKGFRGGATLRQRLMKVETAADVREALSDVDRDLAFPPEAMRVPRGKTAGTQKVSLPEGYLDDLEDATPPSAEAEAAVSGG